MGYYHCVFSHRKLLNQRLRVACLFLVVINGARLSVETENVAVEAGACGRTASEVSGDNRAFGDSVTGNVPNEPVHKLEWGVRQCIGIWVKE